MTIQRLIDRVEEVALREQRRDPLAKRVSVKLDEGVTGKARQTEYATQREHVLTLRLHVAFWANQAQHSDARMAAEHAMKDFLYRDVVGDLVQLRSLVDSADRETMVRAICALIDELRP